MRQLKELNLAFIRYIMSVERFHETLEKYSIYLTNTSNTDNLLEVGKKLFGGEGNEQNIRQSYFLLSNKENELKSIPSKIDNKRIVANNKANLLKAEQKPGNIEYVDEDVLIAQDRNALFMSRCKIVEEQRSKMQQEYGELMEQSIQQKVRLKMEMQKLKAELSEALNRSRPSFMDKAPSVKASLPIMEELTRENQKLLDRIQSFRMATSDNSVLCERVILDLYKPHMEKILGEVYTFSETLSKSEINERISALIHEVTQEISEKDKQLVHEHERNEQLQKEANQLNESVSLQEEEVSRLKSTNAGLSKKIALLKSVANNEIMEMKSAHKKLLDAADDSGATPSSSRAIVVSSSTKKSSLKKSPSRKLLLERESAVPAIPSIDFYVENMKISLSSKVDQIRNQ